MPQTADVTHPLFHVMCPKCDSVNIKDTGDREKFLSFSFRVWVLKCLDCGFKNPQGWFKRAYLKAHPDPAWAGLFDR